LSIPAALVFAFLERPHEAVLWYSALPELLVFTFTIAALLAWIQYCQTGRWRWYVAAGVAFALALLSKESAVVFVPLAVLIAGWRRELWWRLLPAFATSVWYFLSIHGARETHLHFNDGTFSLSAPFWATELRTIGRLLAPWGSVALLVLAAIKRDWRILAACSLWMVVTLLPYSFLTYQGAAPSRHTYLAAVGPAFLLAAAWRTLRDRFPHRQRWLAAMATVCALHQTVYVWAYKHHQFVERARPTEQLLALAKTHQGPIQLRCFPFPRQIAELALSVTNSSGVWIAAEEEYAAIELNFCSASSTTRQTAGTEYSNTASIPGPHPTPAPR
jgi:4-amino-4-deoxy-L-arabinose transferase-like glycosyltransferase